MFCKEVDPNLVSPFYDVSGAGNFYSDTFYWVFDQDCSSNTQYHDWFVFKIKLSQIGTINAIPHDAVYFGSRTFDDFANVVNVDDSGFIYVGGWTNDQYMFL